MEVLGGLLVLVGVLIFVPAAWALVRGGAGWARIATRKAAAIAIHFAVGVAMILGACGGGDTHEVPGAQDAAPEATSTSAPGPAPKT
jgi:hypothetical protein